jgi:hypothetical protein
MPKVGSVSLSCSQPLTWRLASRRHAAWLPASVHHGWQAGMLSRRCGCVCALRAAARLSLLVVDAQMSVNGSLKPVYLCESRFPPSIDEEDTPPITGACLSSRTVYLDLTVTLFTRRYRSDLHRQEGASAQGLCAAQGQSQPRQPRPQHRGLHRSVTKIARRHSAPDF